MTTPDTKKSIAPALAGGSVALISEQAAGEPQCTCAVRLMPGQIGATHSEDCPITAWVRAAFKASGESASGLATAPITVGSDQAPRDPIDYAAKALASKLRSIEADPAYTGIWGYLGAHGYKYTGPSYARELFLLEKALSTAPTTGSALIANTDEWHAGYTAGYIAAEKDATPASPAASALTDAARDVLMERERQMSAEGWTPSHDDEHGNQELAAAAACYALCAYRPEEAWVRDPACRVPPKYWPWVTRWWKPKSPRRDLVKAGALILAEIERLDRAASMGGDKS
jgi:hypothetical protein